MKIYVYLDESGCIHKNSHTKYFAIGGYFTFAEDKNKILSIYKKTDKKMKNLRKMPLKKELKSRVMSVQEKIVFIKNVQHLESFYGIAEIIDKNKMRKEIVESNLFFNYVVKVLFEDCLLPLLNLKNITNIQFNISIDNRNLRVGDLKNLENYLQMVFRFYPFVFKVTYYDSTTNFGIQLADLIVNTFYNYFKDKKIVKQVLPNIDFTKFRISIFPGHFRKGRTKKINMLF